MTTRQHWHHTPLSDRVGLAPDADESWRPDATWREWSDYLRPATIETYQALRRSCQGRAYFRSLRELKTVLGIGIRLLHPILDELAALNLIRLRRERGTIIAIEVNDPPPVPENIDEILRGLTYNTLPPPGPADVRRWTDYWCARWERFRGAPYMRRPRDRPLVSAMLANYGLDRLKRYAYWTLADPNGECGDEIIRRSEISIGTFSHRISQIASACDNAEARRKLDARLQQQAAAAKRRAAAAADDGDWDDEAQQYRTPSRPRPRRQH